jgi:hypothetical protein
MTTLVNNIVAGYGARNYGSFFDTTTQNNAGATSANVMTLNTSDLTSGVSVVSNSRITITQPGIYNMQFSAQFARPGGTGFSTVEVWIKKNGTDVDASNGIFNVPQSGGKVVASWDYMFNVSAGDYYEFYWCSSDTSVQVLYSAAGTGPTRPTTPSFAVTVIQVA